MGADLGTRPRRRPGITDVAALAGVSIGTVSNALNSPQKVAPGTLERVRDAIDTLGFIRDNNARSLVRGTSHAIGLSLIDLSNMLFVDIARGAQDAAGRAGMSLLIANAVDRFDEQERNLAYFEGARVDGILLAPMQESGASIDRLRRHGRPVVVMNYRSDAESTCSVLVDNEAVGYLAARHLIELGRRRILFVGGSDALQPVALRQKGVRQAVREAGGVTLEELDADDLEEADGMHVGRRLSSRPPDQLPDGVIAVTDLLAAGIMRVLVEDGIGVPGAIAVMGCDDNAAAWGGSVPLTTVRMRGFDMGRESMRLLMDEITSPETHTHETITLTPELVARESSLGRASEPLAQAWRQNSPMGRT